VTPTSEVRYCSECGRPSAPGDLARFGNALICPSCKDTYAQKLREGVPAAQARIYGGFWIRFVAVLIDGIILGIVGSVVQLIFFGSLFRSLIVQPGTPPSPALLGQALGAVGLSSLVSTAIGATYEGLFVAKLGATPGKMALSLKVVRPDGSPVDMGRAFGRYFAKLLSGIILFIGYIMAGFDDQKRALHDMICDTRVIKTGN
jgi:uncharacterized RDD family membrane protein YckC